MMRNKITSGILLVAGLTVCQTFFSYGESNPEERFFRAEKTLGAYKDKLSEQTLPDTEAAGIWRRAMELIAGTNRRNEYDVFFTLAKKYHASNIPLLLELAKTRRPPLGVLSSVGFRRGVSDPGADGKIVSSAERDRAEELALLENALPEAEKTSYASRFRTALMEKLLEGRTSPGRAALMEKKTSYQIPPPYGEPRTNGWIPLGIVHGGELPVFDRLPRSCADASSDGEKLRFLYERNRKTDQADRVKFLYAGHLATRYDFISAPDTLRLRLMKDPAMAAKLRNMSENETVTEIGKRERFFTLPPEFRYTALYRELGTAGALEKLAEILCSRGQFGAAATVYEKLLKLNPESSLAKNMLKRIRSPWIFPKSSGVFPSGTFPKLKVGYRNVRRVKISVFPLDSGKMLRSALKNLLEKPLPSQETGFFPYDIFAEDFASNEKNFTGKKTARALVELPVPENLSGEGQTTISIPVSEPGVYLVTLKVSEECREQFLLWLSNSVLSSRNLGSGTLFMVNSIQNGKGLAGIPVSIRDFSPGKDGRENPMQESMFRTGADGTVFVPRSASAEVFRLALAFPSGGGPALSCVPALPENQEWIPNVRRTLFLTDARIVFPGEKFRFAGFPRMASYRSAGIPGGLPDTLEIRIASADGREIYRRKLPVDSKTGSVSDAFEIPPDARPGVYGLYSQDTYYGGTFFLVPESGRAEILLSPHSKKKAVPPGKSFTETFRAASAEGHPLPNLPVYYEIVRADVFPAAPPPDDSAFPWLYNAPVPERAFQKIRSGKTRTDADGFCSVEVDPIKDGGPAAKGKNPVFRIRCVALAGGIPGNATVTAAENPFALFPESAKGFFRMDESCTLNLGAVSVYGKFPPEISGELKVFRLENGKRNPVPVLSMAFVPECGNTAFRLALKTPGVYEAESVLLRKNGKEKEHLIRESALLRVAGPGPDGAAALRGKNFIAVIPEREICEPGKTLPVLLSSNEKNTELLFFRNQYTRPEKITVTGYGKIVGVPVTSDGMPDFFAGVFGISNGKLLNATQKIKVPPKDKKLNISVNFMSDKVPPDGMREVTLRVTDFSGTGIRCTVSAVLLPENAPEIPAELMGHALNPLSAFWIRTRELDTGLRSMLMLKTPPYNAGERLPPLFGPEGTLYDPELEFRQTFRASAGKQEQIPDMEKIIAPGVETRAAFWLPAAETDTSGNLRFSIPRKNGVLRVRAISDMAKAGFSETKISIPAPLTMHAGLPPFLTEGDSCDIFVFLHNSAAREQTVTLNTVSDGILAVRGSGTKTLRIAPGTTEHAVLRVKAKGFGRAGLILTASAREGKVPPVVLRKYFNVLPEKPLFRIETAIRSKNIEAKSSLFIPDEAQKGTRKLELSLIPGIPALIPEILRHLANGEKRSGTFDGTSGFPLVARNIVRQFQNGLSEHEIKQIHHAAGRSTARLRDSVNSDEQRNKVSLTDGKNASLSPGAAAEAFIDLSAARAAGYDVPENSMVRLLKKIELYASSRIPFPGGKSVRPNEWDVPVCTALTAAGIRNAAFEKFLYNRRDELSPHALASLALSMKPGRERTTLIRTLDRYLVENRSAGTAYILVPKRFRGRRDGDETESLSAYLRLLLSDNPKNPGIPPAAHALALRLSASMDSLPPRTLAEGVRALADYSGRAAAESANTRDERTLEAKIFLDGKNLGIYRFEEENRCKIRNLPSVEEKFLTAGPHRLALSASGPCDVYLTARFSAKNVSNQYNSGNDLLLTRKFRRITPSKRAGVPEKAGEPAKDEVFFPGDILEVELICDTPHPLSGLIVSGGIPAGFIPEKPFSGPLESQPDVFVFQRPSGPEFHFRTLPKGQTSLIFRLRAVRPGLYLARPASGRSVYSSEPEVLTGVRPFRIDEP